MSTPCFVTRLGYPFALALAVSCIAPLAGAQTSTPGAPSPPSATDPGNPMTVDESANRHLGKMRDMPRTGDFDYDFVIMMRQHHQGAVDIAQSYLKDGKDPELRRMAYRIVADQNREIAQFEAWQLKRGNAPGAPAP